MRSTLHGQLNKIGIRCLTPSKYTPFYTVMPKAHITPDISDELKIYRQGQGFRLMKPKTSSHSQGSLGHTVKSLLSLPLNVIFLAKNSSILKINENNAATCGFDSASHALGKTIYETYHRDAANFSIAHDISVLKTNSLLIKEESCERIDAIKFYCLTAKLPWYNEAGESIGIIGLSCTIGFENSYEISAALNAFANLGIINGHTNTNHLPNLINGVTLTERELECLKYLLRGMTAQLIAQKLSLSRRTVEAYLGSIKEKLGVKSKSELINLLIEQGIWQ